MVMRQSGLCLTSEKGFPFFLVLDAIYILFADASTTAIPPHNL